MTAWEVLGIPRGSEPKDIKAAYRRRMMECHPDKGGSEEEAKMVNKAYELLTKAPTWQDWVNERMKSTAVVRVVFTSGNNVKRGTWTW